VLLCFINLIQGWGNRDYFKNEFGPPVTVNLENQVSMTLFGDMTLFCDDSQNALRPEKATSGRRRCDWRSIQGAISVV